MSLNLRGRHFLTLEDFTALEIQYLLDLSRDLKEKRRSGIQGKLLAGRKVVLIFDKPSTRTRCAFETACYEEGGHVTFLSDSHMGHKESIEDTARVLGRFYDGIEFRGFKHEDALTLAQFSGVPVWNGLTDQFHPTQVLADFLTIREHIPKPLNKVKLVYAGDARNNVSNTLMIGAAKMGMEFVGLSPKTLWPDNTLLTKMQTLAAESGASLHYEEDIDQAVNGADVIYTDVWVSMGEEAQFAERIRLLKPYQVNMEMLKKTHHPDVIFMHCLPAFHDTQTDIGKDIQKKFGLSEMEVTDEVFRSKHSVVFDQSENRLHTAKAVMAATIGNIPLAFQDAK